ncbi:hypothetical protein, partial [Thermus scotoductus]|uniref:hypothetical protein n=1 Tax=Thermus scotoductus TaxID=37636 RepID=UPI001C12BFD2
MVGRVRGVKETGAGWAGWRYEVENEGINVDTNLPHVNHRWKRIWYSVEEASHGQSLQIPPV